MTYTLAVQSCMGDKDSFEVEADSDDEAKASVPAYVEDWAQEGDWDDEGDRVSVYWELHPGKTVGGGWIAAGRQVVDIPHNYVGLVLLAVRESHFGEHAQDEEDRVLRCDHEWVGVGGCDENPGVWSEGGTAVRIVERCGVCGLRRVRRYTGSQYNPSEHDTVSYSIGARDEEEAPQ
jgi:hypothetical protein